MTEGSTSNSFSLPPGPLGENPSILSLPVLDAMDDLARALDSTGRALLQAPPGAGKTTLVPPLLLHHADGSWLRGKKILMLEPRRLAARACAARMADLLGEPLGRTVGYQVRMDRCAGPDTRIEVITEGILTRRIQNDPELTGIGLVIFDEFHERHLSSDLGLALTLDAAGVFSPDLRLLVMSATMDMEGLSRILDGAEVIESGGRSWPVETLYLPPESVGQKGGGGFADKGFEILPACRTAVARTLSEHEGDILVFLPGAGPIRALAETLAPLARKEAGLDIRQLYGNLSFEAQAAAIAPSRPGRRKIVLATPIAETSLTIEGVRVVVDAGLARVPVFSPRTGMSRLTTLAVSRASADQRRGRAGRTGPGVCYRLWSEHVHRGLIPFNRPEILQADLAPLVLELALWGVTDPCDLLWLDPPPEGLFAAARQLLRNLGALDGAGQITAYGRRLAEAGIHPRLARMVLSGMDGGEGFTACCLASLMEARDFLGEDPDIRLRLEHLERLTRGKGLDGTARQILDQAVHLARRFNIKPSRINPGAAGRLLALAWPGRIAKKRKKEGLSYVMASGAGCVFRSANAVSGHDLIVASELDGNPKNARIFLAAPYSMEDLENDFESDIQMQEEVAWDSNTRSVRAMEKKVFLGLVLEERSKKLPGPDVLVPAMLHGIEQEGLGLLPWTREAESLCARVTFLRGCAGFDNLPDFSREGLMQRLSSWLGPFLAGVSSAAALKHLDLLSTLKSGLTWDQLRQVDTHAPTHIRVPSGTNIRLSYEDDNGLLEAPVLAVRLQEMFGLTTTPTVARGQVSVTLHLLSPAGRPVQITRDLANFWKQTYLEVKKDLMGRYPKHYWPEDPLSAEPTRRAKPRK